MNSVAKDIVDILIDATSVSGVVAFGTDAFVGNQPETPHDCITVYDTGGYLSEPRYEYDRPSVQIRIRSLKYEDGYSKALAIKSCLHGLYETVINGARYVQILSSGDIFALGLDEKRRYEFTINFNTHRTSSP